MKTIPLKELEIILEFKSKCFLNKSGELRRFGKGNDNILRLCKYKEVYVVQSKIRFKDERIFHSLKDAYEDYYNLLINVFANL